MHPKTLSSNFAVMKYTVTQQEATMCAPEFISRYRDVQRFLVLCSECNNYKKMWCCPDFSFDAASITDGYKTVTVLGTTVEFDEITITEGKEPEKAKVIAEEAIDEVMRTLLPQMYALESRVPGSRCFTFRCMLCPEGCTRSTGMPCRHPGKMRYSLEAVGFDVCAVAHDMLGIDLEWSSDGSLPSRITLVTAVFRP